MIRKLKKERVESGEKVGDEKELGFSYAQDNTNKKGSDCLL